MKILHLIDYFQPKIGYQEFFLALNHQKLGHDVQVFCSNYYYPFKNYQSSFQKILGKRKICPGANIEEGLKVHRLKSFEIPNSPLIILFNLKKKIKSYQPDVVICHGMFSFTSYFAAKWKSEFGYKLIYDNHAADFNTLFDTLAKKLYILIYKTFIVNTIKRQKDAIFAIGEEEKDFVKKYYGLKAKDISIIPLGVDTKRFKYASQKRAKIRKKLKFKKDDVVLVFGGKMHKDKDLHILFEAVKKIKDEKIKLLMIGFGNSSYLTQLKKILPSKRAIFIDYLKNKDLPAYFSASDIAVWPGNPAITMLEAMSVGLPLILSKRKGTEYLNKSKAVLWFKRGNVKKLLENIKLLTYNRKVRLHMGTNARNYVRDDLCWNNISKRTIDLLK